MRAARRAAGAAAVIVASVVLGGCGRSGIDEADARQVTEEALRQGALGPFVVSPDVERGTCDRARRPAEGYTTTVALERGGTIEMCIDAATGEPLSLYDEGAGGSGPAITDAEFDRIDAYRPPAPGIAPAVVGAAIALVVADAAGLGLYLRARRRTAADGGPVDSAG